MGTNHSNRDPLKSKSIQTLPERALKASSKEKEHTLLLSCRAGALAMTTSITSCRLRKSVDSLWTFIAECSFLNFQFHSVFVFPTYVLTWGK